MKATTLFKQWLVGRVYKKNPRARVAAIVLHHLVPEDVYAAFLVKYAPKRTS